MRILYTLLLLFLVSCAPSVNSVMNSWTGQHMGSLIATWGPPSQVFTNDDEGGVLIYFEGRGEPAVDGETANSTYPFQAYEGAASAPAYAPSKVGGGEDSRLFWVDADGYIAFWARKGG